MLFDQDGVRPLTSNSYDDEYPQIAGDIVAWQGDVNGADSEIFLYDNGDQEYVQVTNNSFPDFMGDTSCAGSQNGCRPQVQVTPERIVWRTDVNGGSVGDEEFWYYDVDDRASRKLFVSSSLTYDPVVGGPFIAWQSLDYNLIKNVDGVWHGQESDSYNIFVFDGDSIRQLTDYGPGDFRFAEFPWVMGERLIWHQDAPTGGVEIMVYEDEVIRQLTDNEFNEVHFREGDGQVVWANFEESDNTDIYLIDIAPQTLRGSFLVDEADEGTEEVILQLTREFASLDTQLSVSLMEELEGQLEFPSVVSFPRDASVIDIPVRVLDNAVLDGDRVARLLATSPGFQFAEAELTIRDREELALEVAFNDSIVFEDAGDEAVGLRIHRLDESLEKALSVNLDFSPADALFATGEIVIPAGESYTDLWLAVQDNSRVDGLRPIQVTASADGFVPTGLEVQVADAERLSVIINGNPNEPVTLSEGSPFQVTVSRNSLEIDRELTVRLSSNLPDDVSLPESLVLEPGVTEKTIEVSSLDLDFADGPRTLEIAATGGEFEPGIATATLEDNDSPAPFFVVSSAAVLQQLNAGGEVKLFLNREPEADVTINLNARGGVTVTPTSVTLDADNWRAGEAITLNATPAPSETELIILLQWSVDSADAAFANLAGQEVIVSQTSDDFNDVSESPEVRINELAAAIRAGDISKDLTGDGFVNFDDLRYLVNDLLGTSFGDANLDGFFNSGDLVLVFQRGEYEDGLIGNSTWADGDWNGDGEFNSSDMVTAFQSGMYEAKPQTNASEIAAAVDWLFAQNQRGAQTACLHGVRPQGDPRWPVVPSRLGTADRGNAALSFLGPGMSLQLSVLQKTAKNRGGCRATLDGLPRT